MNDYQRTKLDSYRSVVSVFGRYPAEVAAVDALARSAAWVAEQTAALQAAAQDQAGYAAQGDAKASTRQALADAAVPVAQALAAKADEDGDTAAADLYDFDPSDFLYGPQQDALDRAGLVRDAAGAEDPAELAGYGVSAADLDALTAAYDAYDTSLPGARDAIVARSAHTATIERLVPAIGEHLRRRTDRLMARHRGTPFGDEYTAARTLVDR